MKNIIFLIVSIILFSFENFGQAVTDTVFIYDTVIVYNIKTVYDTVIVYDTINVSEIKETENINKEKNILSNHYNAIIDIDTASLKTQLKLFNENKTATIPIDSIIFSENIINSIKNKNPEIMKKLNFIGMLLITFQSAGIAQTTTINKVDTTLKKFELGGGFSTTLNTTHNSFGGNIKFDYLVNKKLSFGVKSILTENNDYNDNIPDNLYGYIYDIYFQGGHLFNISLASTYYLLGKNQLNKGGLYATIGLGYNNWKKYFSYNKTSLWSNEKIDYNVTDVGKSFNYTYCLGIDYKLGYGKIFIETIILSEISNNNKRKYSFSNEWINNFKKGKENYPFINIGYSIIL